MRIQITEILSAFALLGGFYALGFMWEMGRNKASKHKKVCDVCFRDIARVNQALRDAEAEERSAE